MKLEEIDDLKEVLDTDDVGQKRYLMYRVFEQVLEEVHNDLPEPEYRVKELDGENGYVYKLAQDFLTSSSTMEKEKKLQKMLDYLD
jgi:hypothetical protein